jgi:hypothetical protein
MRKIFLAKLQCTQRNERKRKRLLSRIYAELFLGRYLGLDKIFV